MDFVVILGGCFVLGVVAMVVRCAIVVAAIATIAALVVRSIERSRNRKSLRALI